MASLQANKQDGMLTIDAAKKLLEQDEVVIIPTETVYGLAANIYSETAIKKIFQLKGRPLTNPLIVHIASINQLAQVADSVPAEAQLLAQSFWPGPLTLVLPKASDISLQITAGGPTVAVRMPRHPVALQLLQHLSFPLAAPSANPSNFLSPTSVEDVLTGFPQMAERILDGGRCENGIESTVVGFENNEVVVYRLGAIAVDDIETVLGKPVFFAGETSGGIPSPGMLKKHYSPRSRLLVTSNVMETLNQQSVVNIAVLAFSKAYHHPSVSHVKVLSPGGNMEEAAHNLFAYLHQLDRLLPNCIVAELLPAEGLGLAVNDRLMRAATLP